MKTPQFDLMIATLRESAVFRDDEGEQTDAIESEIERLRAAMREHQTRAVNAASEAAMYAAAWQRELGPWMRNKRHHIDACVGGTRALRAAAEDKGREHCCGLPEYCSDLSCAKLLRQRSGIDKALEPLPPNAD